MIAETEAYKLLAGNKEFNTLLDGIRGAKYGNGFAQGIFTYDIPEKPTDLKKKVLAPFVRINTTYDNAYDYADDRYVVTEQRITINFWCETAKQSDRITKMMDDILENGGFERYTTNERPRYKDTDIDLLMNVRKYRVFDWSRLKENEEK